MAKTMLEAMAADKAAHMPNKGFRLIGLDDFEPPGEQLFTIGDFDTLSEAQTALDQRVQDGRGTTATLFIYGAADH